MDANIRKQEENLRLSGLAVIALGFWSIVKIIAFLWIHPEQLMDTVDDLTSTEILDTVQSEIVLLALMAVFTAIAMGFRWYIGIQALREADDKSSGKLYLMITVIYIGFLVVSVLSAFFRETPIEEEEQLTSRFLDLSSAIAMAGIVISSLKLKKLRNGRDQISSGTG